MIEVYFESLVCFRIAIAYIPKTPHAGYVASGSDRAESSIHKPSRSRVLTNDEFFNPISGYFYRLSSGENTSKVLYITGE